VPVIINYEILSALDWAGLGCSEGETWKIHLNYYTDHRINTRHRGCIWICHALWHYILLIDWHMDS